VLGALVRHEPIGWAAVLGTALVLAGAFLASRPDRAASRPGRLAAAASLTAMLLVAAPAMAQQASRQTAWPLPRLSGPIRVDGRSDDAAWRGVALLPMTVYLPTFRGAPRSGPTCGWRTTTTRSTSSSTPGKAIAAACGPAR
jgi:drug/metabolite transporter (DMT)-like permease